MLNRSITSLFVAVLCTLWGCSQRDVPDPEMPLCLYSGGVSLHVKEIRVRKDQQNTQVTVELANACATDVSLLVGRLQSIAERIVVVRAEDEASFRVGPVLDDLISISYTIEEILIKPGQSITKQVLVHDGPILSMPRDSQLTPTIQVHPDWTLRVLKTGREYDVPLQTTGNTVLVFE